MPKQLPNFRALKIAYDDIEREIVKGDKIVLDTIDAATQARIIAQVDEEYNLCYKFNQEKRLKNLQRLKLYNNQKRDAKDVGDPLMFTVFNTIHASLYDDRLMAMWEGRGGEGDEDVEENLNALSEFDYTVMEKDELDYYWNWDAEFFGRGLVLMMEFDRTKGFMAPVPELLDASTFIRDPQATSVNGGMHSKGAMRFGGWEVGATYYELKGLPGYFNLGSLVKGKSIDSMLREARQARDEAQARNGRDPAEEQLSKHGNYEFELLNWMTTIKGEKYLVTLGNQRTQIIRLIKLKYGRRWPIIDRTLYPMSNDWDGVSIPDLTEDKQRMKALLLNLGLISAKSDALPQYLYDQSRIKNKNELNWKRDKFIGVDGRVDNAIMPVQKSTVHQYVNVIMDILDTAAQKATATPDMQQGVQSKGKRTLGELNLISSKVDTRYSMSAKIFGWSEKRFWQQWYLQYKLFFKDKIDEKIVRIQGALAPKWRKLMRDNIISFVDPDLKIESRVISEAKRQREQASFTQFAGLVAQDPDTNRRYVFKKLAKLNGARKEEIDMMFPPTVEEIHAQDENDILNEEQLPTISVNDDHQVHIEIHSKANPNPHTLAHVRQHKKLMIIKRNRADLFPPQQPAPISMNGQPRMMAGGPSPAPTTPTQ